MVYEKYKDEVFLDQMRDVIAELQYNPSLSWDEVEPVLDFFRQQGSPYKYVVRPFLQVAEAKTLAMNIDAVDFYLHAVLWALKHGAVANGSSSRQSSLDVVRKLMGKQEPYRQDQR